MTTITVTADHIAAGRRECEWGCPIALAISDAIQDTEVVAVHGGDIGVDIRFRDGRVRTFRLPPEARLFIGDFDNGSDLAEPFSFELCYPEVTA